MLVQESVQFIQRIRVLKELESKDRLKILVLRAVSDEDLSVCHQHTLSRDPYTLSLTQLCGHTIHPTI